jgi:hypothetical protein
MPNCYTEVMKNVIIIYHMLSYMKHPLLVSLSENIWTYKDIDYCAVLLVKISLYITPVSIYPNSFTTH